MIREKSVFREAVQQEKGEATCPCRSQWLNTGKTQAYHNRYMDISKRGSIPHAFSSTIHRAKTWKQPRCPSPYEGIKETWCVYSVEYYSAIKKDEFLLFPTRQTQLETIVLRERSQAVPKRQVRQMHVLSDV